ncbi:AAA family ATPase [Oceaniglobus trochenteri]|uniref:AAA family ATPase n=1 Tax=Oceaniglobus trochenteri TaxID=2763260 RepID=UPI001CFF6B55|nr:AAA family ATPase [Oceaniglobus trochenteri]
MTNTRSLFDEVELPETWGKQDWNLAYAKTKQLFEPKSPVDQDRLFVGRLDQVADLLDVIYEKGAHAIVHGERGVGKSSLANILRDRVPEQVTNLKFIKENCRPEDSFFDLWSKVLFDFEYEGTPVSDLLKSETRHFIVPKVLETLDRSKQYIFIFDEFDRISDQATKNAMADTIKHFSDYPANITVIVVGVGFSVTELFGAHPSIGRCCQQIQMPRMSDAEIDEIITDRTPEIGVSIPDDRRMEIIDLSQGFPGFAHLIARETLLNAISRKNRSCDELDVSAAVREGTKKAQESLQQAYKDATYSAKDNIYPQVLLACALAHRDQMGLFSASDVKGPLCDILERPVEFGHFARHLAAFCDDSRGPVLRKTGKPKRYQYQFIEAPIRPYIVMVGKRDGLI